jgi:hypothetical protein
LVIALFGVLLLGAISVGVFVVGTRNSSTPPVWQLCLIGLVWFCALFCVFQFIRNLPVGELEFDGQQWYFADKVGTVSVRFDGQVCMLLRFEDDLKHACWFWFEAQNSHQHDPSHWLDLRRAVYSRANEQNFPNLI